MFRIASLALCLLIAVSAALSAVGRTFKVTIMSPDLPAPVEIAAPKLNDFSPWMGPGTFVNGVEQTKGFIIDWKLGPVATPLLELSRYEVAFHSGGRAWAYTVDYVYDPAAGKGYVFLPGPRDRRYSVNTWSIKRTGNLEGNWFAATPEWDRFVLPVLGLK